MSREIKFRAWHEDNNEMVYFDKDKLVKDQYQMQHLAKLMRGDYGDFLMQYTGLKDKSGVELYDGDIYIKRGIVFECEFEWEIYEKKDCTLIDGDFEIIGNIYENPELLSDCQ